MQIAGDPVPVLIQRQPFGLGPARGELERDARLGRERGHHVGLGLRKRRRAVAATDGKHATDVARHAEREHHRGPNLAHRAAGRRRGPLVGGEVGRRHRLARGQHPAGQRLAGQQHQPADRVGPVTIGVGDREPASSLVGQREHGEVGTGKLACLPGDAGQHLARRRAGQQPGGDLSTGRDPALLTAGRLVQPGVLHRHAGRGAQRDQDGLVILGEPAATALIGQVQVAEHLVADPHRHAEKAAHRRVPVREARRCRVRGDVGQAQRARIVNQQAEQAAAFRPVIDRRDLVLAQAHRDELGQPQFPAFLAADDTERAVGRVDQADRGLDDPPQGRLQVQAGPDRHDRLKQTAHPVPGRQHRLQPALQLGEQLIKLQVRKQPRAARGLRHQILPGDDAP